MYCPSIVTGPYSIESYKGGKVYLVLNEYYKGNQYDEKPTIQRLVYGGEEQEELVQDIVSILHVFSCRLYGLRKYKKQIEGDETIAKGVQNGDSPD